MSHTLSTDLQRAFRGERVPDLQLEVAFDWQAGYCRFNLNYGSCTLLRDEQSDNKQTDDQVLVIYFHDERTLRGVLDGSYPIIDAFMSGHLRSNGYLMWVFQVLAAFSSK